jgi:hypothetical protein
VLKQAGVAVVQTLEVEVRMGFELELAMGLCRTASTPGMVATSTGNEAAFGGRELSGCQMLSEKRDNLQNSFGSQIHNYQLDGV